MGTCLAGFYKWDAFNLLLLIMEFLLISYLFQTQKELLYLIFNTIFSLDVPFQQIHNDMKYYPVPFLEKISIWTKEIIYPTYQ